MKTLLSLALLFFLTACEPISSFEPNTKPDGVPESAFWVGGADGGVYIDISKQSKQEYYSKIYFDTTGEIWYEGVLHYSGEKELDISNKNIYSFWDGDNLHLVNNEYLTSSNQ
jgi:hypothetical protein